MIAGDQQLGARGDRRLQRRKERRFRTVVEVGGHQPHLAVVPMAQLAVQQLARLCSSGIILCRERKGGMTGRTGLADLGGQQAEPVDAPVVGIAGNRRLQQGSLSPRRNGLVHERSGLKGECTSLTAREN